MTSMEQAGQSAGSDVLSGEEEVALARIREIVAGIRDHESTVGVEAVKQALMAAGASKEEGLAGKESAVFILCGARFSVMAGRHGCGVVEINFASENR
jgi:hypothetical protein